MGIAQGLNELDCETAESAVRSLADLTGVKVSDIRARLAAWRYHNFESFAQRRGMGGFDLACEELWRRVIASDEKPIAPVVCWFHATRVLPGTDFSQGLLPLPTILPQLIDSLERNGIRRATLTGSFHDDAHEQKMAFRGSWGPFGHLVKEAAFSPGQDHFFRAPEAVVDLGFDLEAFRTATVPCVVKFRSSEPRDDVALLALVFAYMTTWGRPADWDCSTTWGGDGEPVAPENIVSVQFLDPAAFYVDED